MSDKEQYYEYIKLQWDFIKRFLGRERSEQFWEEITDEADKIIDSVSQPDQEYVRDCLLAVLHDFERKRKK